MAYKTLQTHAKHSVILIPPIMLIGAQRPQELLPPPKVAIGPPDVRAMGPRLDHRLPVRNISFEQAVALAAGLTVDGLPQLYSRQGLADDALREVAKWINPYEVERVPVGKWAAGDMTVPEWSRRLWARQVADESSPLWEMLYANEAVRGVQLATLRTQGLPARQAWRQLVSWRHVFAVSRNKMGGVHHRARLVEPGKFGRSSEPIFVVDDTFADGAPRLVVRDRFRRLPRNRLAFYVVRWRQDDDKVAVWRWDVKEDGEATLVEDFDPQEALSDFVTQPCALRFTIDVGDAVLSIADQVLSASAGCVMAFYPTLPSIRVSYNPSGVCTVISPERNAVPMLLTARYTWYKHNDMSVESAGAAALFLALDPVEPVPMGAPAPTRRITIDLDFHYDLNAGIAHLLLPSDANGPVSTGLRNSLALPMAACFLPSAQVPGSGMPVLYDNARNSAQPGAQPVWDRDGRVLQPIRDAPNTNGSFAVVPVQRGRVAVPTTFGSEAGFEWPREHPDYVRIAGQGEPFAWFGIYMERLDPRNGVTGELQLAVLDIKRQLMGWDMEEVELRLGCKWTLGERTQIGRTHTHHFKLAHLPDRTVAQLVPWNDAYEDNYQHFLGYYWTPDKLD